MDNNKEIVIAEIDLTTPKEIFLADEAMNINLGGKGKSRFGKSRIKVKGNEGTIPHFHIESVSGGIYCCVCIYVAKYFLHGGHDNQKELDVDQRTILNEFMKEIDPSNGMPIWNSIAYAWQTVNPSNTFDTYCIHNNLDKNNLTQPNYTLMTESCHAK